jgi:hypothetical protein
MFRSCPAGGCQPVYMKSALQAFRHVRATWSQFVILVSSLVIPASSSVIPAKAGIHAFSLPYILTHT